MIRKILLFALLISCLPFIGCGANEEAIQTMKFSGRVTSIRPNGYAVDFDNAADVFDLAIVRLEAPDSAKGVDMQVVLNEKSNAPFFRTNSAVNFELPNEIASEFFGKLEARSSLNLVYSSFMKNVRLVSSDSVNRAD